MTSTSLRQLFDKYRSKGLLVDSNLLLLYFIGRADPDLIAEFKALRSHRFTADDFNYLAQIIHRFRMKLFTTPHILTEVSNLSNKLHGEPRLTYFQSIVPRIQELQERYVESRLLSRAPYFPQFGLTDTGIIHMAPGSMLVLTIDSLLAGYLRHRKVDAINFMDLRMLWTYSTAS